MTGDGMERTLTIGLAGIDWPGLGVAMARGWAPALSALAARGASGPLRADAPLTGPAPWVSLATGLPVERHGVVADDDAWAGGVRAASRASWRAPALWEHLAQADIATASVAWPASGPGAAWRGLHVDDAFARANDPDWESWAMPLDCVPPHLRETLREARVHPADIDGAMLKPLVPDLAAVDQARDTTLAGLAVAMAHAATVQAAAVALLGEAPDACFVHHVWMAEVRAQRTGDTAPYDRVIEGAWRFLDGMVARLIDLARDRLVLIVAPGLGTNAGVLLAAGPGVGAATTILGARWHDIAPTLLARHGLRDPALPGHVLPALASPADGIVRPMPQREAETDHVLLAAVVAQGYALPPPPPAAWRAARLAALGEMLLARAPERALEAADAALAIQPATALALGVRAYALVALGRPDPLPDIADRLAQIAPDRPWGALARGAYHALKGDARSARPHLLVVERSDDAISCLRAGAAWLVLRRPADADRAFGAALTLDPGNADAELGRAMAAMALRRPLQAEAAARRVLAADPAHAAAWLQLRAALHRQGRRREVADADTMLVRLGAAAPQRLGDIAGSASNAGRA